MGKHKIDIDQVVDMIIEGLTFREIAKKLNIPLSTFHDNISKDEHSARVKMALEISADTYVDKGEEAILSAKSDPNEMQRARLLDQHYRWKAAKRRPKTYGDKVDFTTDGKALQPPTINILPKTED